MEKIKIIASNKSWIEQSAVDQLKGIASLKGIIKAVGLPDLHPGKTPVGAAFVSEEMIYPHIIGNDIGCGMSFFMTDVKKHKVKKDKWIKKLEATLNIKDILIEDTFDDTTSFKEKMGTIGGGNHFAEFQEIEKVFHEEAFERLELSKKHIYLLVHSGSRGYGESILDEAIKKYHAQKGLKIGTFEADAYLKKHERAIYWAENNRKMIANRFMKLLGIEMTRVLDSTHNSIVRKAIKNKEVYIHRKGAAPADVGAVVIPGSRGDLTYIVMPKPSEVSAYSIAHGAGRKWSRGGCKERLMNKYTKKTIKQTQLGGAVICKDKSLLFEEAPEAYKNIETVIKDLLEADLIEVIATLKPVITYKG
ncbi:RNA ligase RtcB family protein [Crassaminicella profunda]|uniref:RNA ligase RtcB family protein n=1 Tax=Crassaminicella profunda TaxID=1286698 RepID=UPI001CA61655|nr:RNA ligase RtcB family protein [Crassaminicella profunda]QZY53988.1 RNA ligase RtcB family protein [Crassaminicella profunda]